MRKSRNGYIENYTQPYSVLLKTPHLWKQISIIVNNEDKATNSNDVDDGLTHHHTRSGRGLVVYDL